MKSRNTWFLLTAGLKPTNFEDAAKRVVMDSKNLFAFEKIINLGVDNFEELCPLTFRKYGKYLNSQTRGFGFYSWKAEFVHNALSGRFGKCDGIVWIEGGCEVYSSYWTRKKFNSQIMQVEDSGYGVYTLQTPERNYTKNDLINKFSIEYIERPIGQFQATHFFLYGNIGRLIASEWSDRCLEDISNLDLLPSKNGEIEGFVEHRSDQSVLSLTIKKLGLMANLHTPPTGNRGLKSIMIAVLYPVWVTRNRTGKSIIPYWLKKIGLMSISLSFIKKKKYI